nr:zwei Ig domain protein zig-8-like [Procambarus clarkii]
MGVGMGVEEEEENLGVDPASWSDYLNTLFDPVFDPGVTSNVSAVEGQTAHLVCRVNNLGTKTVSWIRHRDTHILTVGSFTYTSDHRFSALHREGTNEWTLQIRHPVVDDTGLYECQVSTKPIRAYLVSLEVVGKCQPGPYEPTWSVWRLWVSVNQAHTALPGQSGGCG